MSREAQTPSPAEASLKKRYAVKLISNLASIPLFFALEAVLPRALGPSAYGNYSFATNFFQQAANFLDMGSSTCFYNSLSKRQSEYGLAAYYLRVGGLVLALTLAFCGLMFIPGVGGRLMPDVPLFLAPLAAMWAYLTWGAKILRSVNDALGITARSEIVRIVVNLASMLAILVLFWAGWLNLFTLFAHQYLTFILSGLGFAWVIRVVWRDFTLRDSLKLTRERRRVYRREFVSYSAPLFILALVSVLVLCGERWLLQFFDGSVEQGYFSLSQKVGMACFLFVTAMTPLIMRELAVAHARKDLAEMGRLLDRLAPALYAVAAWFCCFTALEAQAVTGLFGGQNFARAALPVQIMAFYPLHQTYGQITGSVYYASGETKAWRNLSVACLLGGFACSWFLLAPADFGGLNMGAMGLAVKMVGVQIVSANIALLGCARIVPFRLGRNLAHQLLCPAVFCLAAWGCRELTLLLLPAWPDLLRFFVSGFGYVVLTALCCLALPWLAGLRREDLLALRRKRK